jgi:hypothetical protein
VRVLLQARIAVGWEHLYMSVDVDPLALGLFEQFLKHLEVAFLLKMADRGPERRRRFGFALTSILLSDRFSPMELYFIAKTDLPTFTPTRRQSAAGAFRTWYRL